MKPQYVNGNMRAARPNFVILGTDHVPQRDDQDLKILISDIVARQTKSTGIRLSNARIL